MQEKFAKLFSSIAFLLKIEDKYTEKDFQSEAKELLRLINKNTILGNIVSFLDPLFLIVGLLAKFAEMAKKVRTRKEREIAERVEKNGGSDNATRVW